jgi:hypothetical protein
MDRSKLKSSRRRSESSKRDSFLGGHNFNSVSVEDQSISLDFPEQVSVDESSQKQINMFDDKLVRQRKSSTSRQGS